MTAGGIIHVMFSFSAHDIHQLCNIYLQFVYLSIIVDLSRRAFTLFVICYFVRDGKAWTCTRQRMQKSRKSY